MNAEKVFTNGKIYTVNENRDWAEAVAIDDGKIVFVGSDSDAKDYIGESTEVVDLQGKMMLPGFMDGHCHPVLAAHYTSGVYLEIDYDLDTCLAEIRKYVNEHPDKKTYFGLGYAEWLFDEKGPKKEMLDAICADKPMLMLGSGGHEGWANSKALEMAGITKNTADPIPGFQYYGRDEQGNPSGHLMETIPLLSVMGELPFFDDEVIKGLLSEISAGYAAMGVTSVADMGIFRSMADKGIKMVKDAIDSGKFVQRFTGCGGIIESDDRIEEHLDHLAALHEKYDDDRFRINFVKIINDGTLESRSAALTTPYCEDGSVVETMISGDRLAEIGLMAAKRGLDMHIHALGDASARESLKMMKAIREAGYDDMRVTNAHTQMVLAEDRPLFGKYDLIANTTTVWHYGNPDMIPVIGERADDTFTLKSIIDGGAKLSLGSDFPVDEYGREPLKGIEMGVTRQLYDRPDSPVLKPESEKLSVDDCIAGYTINIAYQLHVEDRMGSIEKGKYADFVILEKNLFEIPAAEIHNVKVCETIVEGKTVYQA